MPRAAVIATALEAWRLAATVETEGLLLDTLGGPALGRAVEVLGVDVVGDAPLSSSGGVITAIDGNVLGVVIDGKTLEERRRGLRPYPVMVIANGRELLGLTPDLELIDVATRRIVGVPPERVDARAGHFSLSPDGSIVAVGNPSGRAGVLALYDAFTGQPLAEGSSELGDEVRHVTFSPDGKRVAVVIDSGAVAVFETRSGTALHEQSATRVAVTRLVISPDDSEVAVGREDGSVELMSMDDAERRTLTGQHDREISWLDFDATGRRLVSTSRDGRTTVWDAQTGQVVSGALDTEVEGRTLAYFRGGSADDVVTIDADGTAWEWDVGAGLVNSVEGVTEPGTAIRDGRLTVTGSVGWDLVDLVTGERRAFGSPASFPDLSDPLTVVAADGHRVVVVESSGRVALRDAASAQLVRGFEQRASTDAPLVAIDADGEVVAFRTFDGDIVVVRDDGTIVDTISVNSSHGAIQSLQLDRNGDELVVSTGSGTTLWYELDGMLANVVATRDSAFSARFVDDGTVAVQDRDGTIHVVDPRTGQVQESIGLDSASSRFALDGAGRSVATIETDAAVRLWDRATGDPIGEPIALPEAPLDLGFDANGDFLVVTGATHTMWIDVRPSTWATALCGALTRSGDHRGEGAPGARGLTERALPEVCR